MQKSLKELSLPITEPEYRQMDALSYSTLSTFLTVGFSGLSHLFDRKETTSLTFGSIVDTILTDGMDEFNKKFKICDFPKITDSLIAVTKRLALSDKNTLDEFTDDEISDACIMEDYYKNDKYRNFRIKSVKENCDYYYKLLKMSKDYIIISNDEYNRAMKCVQVLKDNPYTKNYFTINAIDTHIEKLYQLKFSSSFNNIPIRCMFDLIMVDHEKKIIIPCDLKTTSSPEYEFHKDSFYKWHYYIQAQLYTYIIEQVISEDDYFKDFKVQPFRFIVINKETLSPVVFEYQQSIIKDSYIASFKYKDRVVNYNCVNWRYLLCELKLYLDYYNKYNKYTTYPFNVQNDLKTNGLVQIYI